MADAALERLKRKIDMLRRESDARLRPNLKQHMEELAALVEIVERGTTNAS